LHVPFPLQLLGQAVVFLLSSTGFKGFSISSVDSFLGASSSSESSSPFLSDFGFKFLIPFLVTTLFF